MPNGSWELNGSIYKRIAEEIPLGLVRELQDHDRIRRLKSSDERGLDINLAARFPKGDAKFIQRFARSRQMGFGDISSYVRNSIYFSTAILVHHLDNDDEGEDDLGPVGEQMLKQESLANQKEYVQNALTRIQEMRVDIVNPVTPIEVRDTMKDLLRAYVRSSIAKVREEAQSVLDSIGE